ncbi:predicted protein [Naegleria gruberi]|uniref:Predicted protein n=1 Tax=Naegleria gruberi TaxID=5762 RepID=D2VCR9_NAEGR|nr:uncharacterized protein NAEGRDRAFT_66670 [Naegleria gruberi]EFC45356.1 predicted protein [Naegleria gruberi]|eukprot:XP_002678100.1 predicted protein [Naegleria gruberi strain NEG-M]
MLPSSDSNTSTATTAQNGVSSDGDCCYYSNNVGSFGEMYYRLLKRFRDEEMDGKYEKDHNILITADSLLHAFHYSYKSILESIEVQILFPKCKHLFTKLFKSMKETLIKHKFSDFANPSPHSLLNGFELEPRPIGLIEQGLYDLDFFITLSTSLIHGKVEDSYFMQNRHNVHYLFELIHRRCELGNDFSSSCCLFTIFGEKRFLEFRLYQPNWFYIRDYMNNYFKLLSWCNNTFMDITNIQQFTLILLVWLLVEESKTLGCEYSQIEHCYKNMIGISDSANCDDITTTLREYFNMTESGTEKIAEKLYYTLTLPENEKAIREIQQFVIKKNIGLNQISNANLKSPKEGVGHKDEFTFCFFGRKFTLDSFIFHNVTFDRLKDEENMRYLPRVIPTILDVGYTFLDSPVAEEILKNTDPYHDIVLDKLNELKTSINEYNSHPSIHNIWLDTLKGLSTISPLFQKVEKYTAKVLITQFSSFSHLKYDSSLFAKQHIETDIELMVNKEVFDIDTEASEYVDIGFLVEGSTTFFTKFVALVTFVRDLLQNDVQFSSMPISSESVKFYNNFISTLSVLAEINRKQTETGEKLTEQETSFLSNMIFAKKDPKQFKTQTFKQVLGTTSQNYSVSGWYPNLFFKRDDAGRFKPIVIDIHRYPDVDNGVILWEAVGPIHLFEMSLKDKKFFGPMFSQFEFITPYTTKLNNATWKSKLQHPNLEYNEWMKMLSTEICLGKNFIGYSHLDHFTCAEYTTGSPPSSGSSSSPNSPSTPNVGE